MEDPSSTAHRLRAVGHRAGSCTQGDHHECRRPETPAAKRNHEQRDYVFMAGDILEEVLEAFDHGWITAYRLRGHVSDLAWYQEGRQPTEYVTDWAEPLLSGG